MAQSRADSFMEALTNIAIGLFVSTIANWIILPVVLGVELTMGDNLLIGIFFTVISILRSYTLRRLFNGRSVWDAIKDVLPVPRNRFKKVQAELDALQDRIALVQYGKRPCHYIWYGE